MLFDIRLNLSFLSYTWFVIFLFFVLFFSSRYPGSSNDRPRDVVSRTFKSSSNTKEDVRNNQNMISMVLVIVLALFFGVLAVMYLGLGGKTETFPALPTGRYSE